MQHPLGISVGEQLKLAIAEGTDGIDGILRKIANSRGTDDADKDPFPEEVVADAKGGITSLVAKKLSEWSPAGKAQEQNIDMRL